jgi:hypothetical protein
LGDLLKSGSLKEDLMINESKMAYTMEGTFKLIIIDSLKTLPDATKVSSQITFKAIEKFGGKWHCFIWKKNFGTYSIQTYYENYIQFSISDLSLTIFQTRD